MIPQQPWYDCRQFRTITCSEIQQRVSVLLGERKDSIPTSQRWSNILKRTSSIIWNPHFVEVERFGASWPWMIVFSKAPKKCIVSGLRVHRLRPARRHFYYLKFLSAMKRCPIAAKIAGSIGILPCCVLNHLFTSQYENFPICEAYLDS